MSASTSGPRCGDLAAWLVFVALRMQRFAQNWTNPDFHSSSSDVIPLHVRFLYNGEAVTIM